MTAEFVPVTDTVAVVPVFGAMKTVLPPVNVPPLTTLRPNGPAPPAVLPMTSPTAEFTFEPAPVIVSVPLPGALAPMLKAAAVASTRMVPPFWTVTLPGPWLAIDS